MKASRSLRLILASSAVILTAIPALATTYYWDNNGTTAGFGTAAGNWTDPTVSRWSTSNAGTATPMM